MKIDPETEISKIIDVNEGILCEIVGFLDSSFLGCYNDEQVEGKMKS